MVLWGWWLSHSAGQGSPPPSAALFKGQGTSPPAPRMRGRGMTRLPRPLPSLPVESGAPSSSPPLFLQSHPVPGPLPASPGAFLWRQLPWAGGPAWLGRSWQGPPPLPRGLGRLLRGTGAPGSSEAPRLPRAAPLAGGAMSPLAQGEGGRPGVSPPQTRSFQETGAAPGGDGRVDGVKSLFKGVCSPGGGAGAGAVVSPPFNGHLWEGSLGPTGLSPGQLPSHRATWPNDTALACGSSEWAEVPGE